MLRDPYHLDDDENPRPRGRVLDEDRGRLPYVLLHGEALVVCAAWAVGEAGIELLDHDTPWSDVQEAGAPLVLHDALCPMTPAQFLADCVERCLETGHVVVGVRPVTDTVKQTADGVLGGTVDREDLRGVSSPVVLPADLLAHLPDLPATDFPTLLESLVLVLGADRSRWLELVEAPAQGRRVHDADDVRLLEQLTAAPRSVFP
ncbi:2-C-methyl-D-erythritol 4-phosphate cytidylyltransferase [Nocardioides campestrisoli]|uniref:2-C-methyl-D-erythritol 4-phosphate cytidylyltransferase n=1 Tax=Nocardioides campestrisoli TaxID=2736757 RepID=UPI0015E654E2|nr:2-C-methyl-D-erythritol 4-phosphate cytidylyltransferase [Nocardioides campestrisoli]